MDKQDGAETPNVRLERVTKHFGDLTAVRDLSFVITNFNAGSTVTFPLFVWSAARVAVPPQINIIATLIFFVTVALMLLAVWQPRRAERMAAVRPEQP